MATYRWNPFPTLTRFDREFDHLVRRAYGSRPPVSRSRVVRTARPAAPGFVPPVEVVRDGSDVVIRTELPGIDVDKDVTVEIERGRLVLRGERRDDREDTTGGVLVREVRYGSFRREFGLPEGVSADHIEATYDAGVLSVRVRGALQTLEAGQGGQRIPVTASSAPVTEAAAPVEAPAAGTDAPAASTEEPESADDAGA